jgi:phospholipase C
MGTYNGEQVNGLANADPAHTLQVSSAGTLYACLRQNDPNLTVPPLNVTCHDATVAPAFDSHFANAPFAIDGYIPQESLTRDLVHRYYQEQYQIDHGQQDRYVTGSDRIGVDGHYGSCPCTRTCTAQFLTMWCSTRSSSRHSADRSSTPVAGCGTHATIHKRVERCVGNDFHSVVDANGMPTNYPLYASPVGSAAKDMPRPHRARRRPDAPQPAG